jgi:hypothetical protein
MIKGVISPDGRQLAFVSTRGAHTADVWTLDLTTQQAAQPDRRADAPRRARQSQGRIPALVVARRQVDRIHVGPPLRVQAAQAAGARLGASAGAEHLRDAGRWHRTETRDGRRRDDRIARDGRPTA